MNIQFHKIQCDQSLPRSPIALGSARRANSACGGRTISSPAPHGVAKQGFKRGEVLQALIDVALVGVALLLVACTAVAVAGSAFILLFVRT
jgi:hypothetical protein